jgi:hypothetical protein
MNIILIILMFIALYFVLYFSVKHAINDSVIGQSLQKSKSVPTVSDEEIEEELLSLHLKNSGKE